METRGKITFVLAITSMLSMLLMATVASADWNPGDPFKMHYPQMPNPNGWDVEFFRVPIADDWKCIESGPVSDIHFWTSWAQDLIGQVQWFKVSVYKDVPAVVGTPGSFSHPGDLIVSRIYDASQFVVRTDPDWIGNQGFYDPEGDWNLNDHKMYQQINIVDKTNPLFYQEKDTIYWLAISADWELINQSPVGWKTSLDHFNDAAVFWSEQQQMWLPLYDPYLQQQGLLEPLDLAFVITPEPSTLILLALGSGLLLRKR